MLCLLVVVLLSTGVIYCASVLSNTKLLWIQQIAGQSSENEQDDEQLDLTMPQVLALPVSTSAMLLLLFYYFKYLQYVLLLVLTIACGYSLYDNLIVLLKLARRSRSALDASGRVGASKWQNYASCAVSVIVVYKWIQTSHYFYLDILALSLTVSFISAVRFPSLRVAAVCLLALFVYDVFWVFFSERLFNENVMVAVATRDATNPLHALHKCSPDNVIIAFMSRYLSPSITLPIKIIVPAAGLGGRDSIMLGLGDITLPGLLIALAYRHDFDYCLAEQVDEERGGAPGGPTVRPPDKVVSALITSRKGGDVFEWSLFSYSLGLCLAFYCSFTFQHAQPALLYIVPCVLGAISIRARQTGRLKGLWSGDDGSDGSAAKR